MKHLLVALFFLSLPFFSFGQDEDEISFEDAMEDDQERSVFSYHADLFEILDGKLNFHVRKVLPNNWLILEGGVGVFTPKLIKEIPVITFNDDLSMYNNNNRGFGGSIFGSVLWNFGIADEHWGLRYGPYLEIGRYGILNSEQKVAEVNLGLYAGFSFPIKGVYFMEIGAHLGNRIYFVGEFWNEYYYRPAIKFGRNF